MGQDKIVRVVIDTNVVISALLFGGLPGNLIPLWKSGRVEPLASRDSVNEYLRVLAYPKFNLDEEDINYLFHQEILPFFDVINVKRGQPVVNKDPADDMFIHCALAGNAKVVISGDAHLLALKSYRTVEIITPAQVLAMLKKD